MAGRAWVKLDTGYFENPKIGKLGHGAILLHLALVTYCAEQLTDGHISAEAIVSRSNAARLPIGSRSRARSQLLRAGLLERNGDGYVVHDFLAMNPELERARVEARRAAWRERQRRHREEVTP